MSERTAIPVPLVPAVEPPTPTPLGCDDSRASNVSAALDDALDLTDAADADDALWREAMRDMDAQRPHRPLFGGMY